MNGSTQAESAALGSLALSAVRPRSSSLSLRAARWHRDLARLGVHVPFVVAHDLGLYLACPNDQLARGPRIAIERLGAKVRRKLVKAYQKLVAEIAESEAAQRSRALRMSDDLVVVLLARLLAGAVAHCRVAARPDELAPLDATRLERADERLGELFALVDRGWDLALIEELVRSRLYVLTVVDALDLDTLRLFGMVGGDVSFGSVAQIDLLSALASPEANDVVDFSLEILPSVLETKARPGASAFAAHGYAGLSRKGSIDGLVLSELAWDEAELLRRIAEDEVLYYAREHAHEDARRLHLLLIDASASMRGDRMTFARGMALAAAKKLSLAGEDVVFRFFDSHLYEPHAARGGRLPVSHLLAFKGERGRNPARVFRELLGLLELAAGRDARQPVVHLFTHAALYVPRDTMARIAKIAKISAVFMLPSEAELHLDYLDLLDAHWVVDHAALASRGTRALEARRILDAS